jgi:copper transporter 1
MLFNLDTEKLCIVFSWWRVNSIGSLILSCFIVAFLTASFEFLRYVSRKYDLNIYASAPLQLQEGGSSNSEEVTTGSPTQDRVIR